MVGGPGFEPGASRSRTVTISCPPVSAGVLEVPPDLEMLSVVSFCDLLYPSGSGIA